MINVIRAVSSVKRMNKIPRRKWTTPLEVHSAPAAQLRSHFQIVVNRLLLIPDYLRILTRTFVINFNLYLHKARVP